MLSMKRAAVLIGVDRVGGGLPPLADAASGAKRMAAWAEHQGVQHVAVLTDADGEGVAVADVKRAIRAIVELGSVEHLCVYFAGHGANVNRNEVWLLSGAPVDPQEAVNVAGSVQLARYGTIPYVAVISDACRSAAAGLQMQGVLGGDVFPNDLGGTSRFVDQFYSCGLGRPAHELKVGASYEAVYTAALLAALEGREPVDPPDPEFVRPRPLRDHLARALSDMSTRGLDQAPEAIIASDPDAWISVLPPGAKSSGRRRRRGRPLHPAAHAVDAIIAPWETRLRFSGITPDAATHIDRDVAELSEAVPHLDDVPCSFIFRGAIPVEAFTGPRGECEVRYRSAVAVRPGGARANSVLVRLRDGTGVVLPALRGYDASVDFDREELVSVAYERRSEPDLAPRMQQVRELRAVAAIASRDGRFTLAPETVEELVWRMREVKRIDPALAVYAAYAYADIGRADLVRDMARYVQRDIGGVLFDIAMLSQRPRGRRTIGQFPLLGQGWALLRAFDLTLPSALEGIERTVLPSLWTLFSAEGCEQLAAAVSEGAI
jgi:hypothetical protein